MVYQYNGLSPFSEFNTCLVLITVQKKDMTAVWNFGGCLQCTDFCHKNGLGGQHFAGVGQF